MSYIIFSVYKTDIIIVNKPGAVRSCHSDGIFPFSLLHVAIKFQMTRWRLEAVHIITTD
jgi:hypothetical protein